MNSFFNKRKLRKFLRIKQEDVILIVLCFMAFSCGVWANYRQLWMQSVGFSVVQVSKILSIALVCSAVISFIISLFSTRVRVKSVVMMALIFRSISLATLLFTNNLFLVNTCILLSIMCEVIFSVAYYPLLTFVGKSERLYSKKSLIDYLSRDAAIISCGLLLGIKVGNVIFDYNTCLFISLISGIFSSIFLLLFHKEKKRSESNYGLINSIKKTLKNKVTLIFLLSQLVVNISYGIICGLMMIMLTSYIGFEVSFASIFIIVCNLFGSLFCTLFIKYGKKIPVYMSIIIKFGFRACLFLLAFLCNNLYIYILAIIGYFVTSRILEEKVTGTYVNRISKDNQFLFGNVRYFIMCLGEGIGVYLAGIFITNSLSSLFLGASISTFIQVFIMLYLERVRNKKYLIF